MVDADHRMRGIRALLRAEQIFNVAGSCFDCLPPSLRAEFEIVECENVSSHDYDPFALELIGNHENGWVLDCGAGYRKTIHPNVVNFEICRYPSTDVLGVAEAMPFKDGVFDAIVCLAVLEHVKDPFKAAQEICRVLKPGGKLYCVVPFLQALHGYPHHYYNMTAQGLKNLFDRRLQIDRQIMLTSGLPIWSVSWLLQSWLNGLSGETKERFASLTVAQLARDPLAQLSETYVMQLSNEKNFELASTTALFATKPVAKAGDPVVAASFARVEELSRLHAELREQKQRAQAAENKVLKLDARLNALRRSRWWRLRRRLLHTVGAEDYKD